MHHDINSWPIVMLVQCRVQGEDNRDPLSCCGTCLVGAFYGSA